MDDITKGIILKRAKNEDALAHTFKTWYQYDVPMLIKELEAHEATIAQLRIALDRDNPRDRLRRIRDILLSAREHRTFNDDMRRVLVVVEGDDDGI
jgi:hypothetical protein